MSTTKTKKIGAPPVATHFLPALPKEPVSTTDQLEMRIALRIKRPQPPWNDSEKISMACLKKWNDAEKIA